MKPTRRNLLKTLGISAASLPFLQCLPSLAGERPRPQRLVFMFSPNGTIPTHFWPDSEGPLTEFKRVLAPLTPFKDRTLTLQGISNKVRGDGDGHMRGMSCLLTAIELFPGNIQGGSHTPAGWASGISIDQELKNFLQSKSETRTRFGSLEFGVAVPDRADPWTRWSYAGPNQPVAPIDDPYQMFEKMFGRLKDQESLKSILDDLQADFKAVASHLSSADKKLLDEHLTYVREMEQDLQRNESQSLKHPAPAFDPGVANANDNIPQLSRMQIELIVSSFANDQARIANLQYTNSVGNARMRWLGIEEGHHTLSHDPDLNTESFEKLTKINTWFAEELAFLAKRLAETPDPTGHGTLLDNTTILWTNELGKGNSHTLDNIPFVLVGNGCGFKTGQAKKFDKVPHNRLWLSIAHAFGHNIPTFGNPRLSEGGPLDLT